MALVLAVEPNSSQGSTLQTILRDHAGAEVLVVDSKESALSALNDNVPDLLLVSALLSPRDEEDLLDRLKSLPNATHSQTLTIPQLRSEAPSTEPRFSMFRRRRSEPVPDGCDPELFAREVSDYLQRAAELKSKAAARTAVAAHRVEPPNLDISEEPEPASQDSGVEPAMVAPDAAADDAATDEATPTSNAASEAASNGDRTVTDETQPADGPPEVPGANAMAREVAEVQRAAEERLETELAKLRRETDEQRTAELAEVQREAQALRNAEVLSARAAAEAEAEEALAAELGRVREEAERAGRRGDRACSSIGRGRATRRAHARTGGSRAGGRTGRSRSATGRRSRARADRGRADTSGRSVGG